MQMLASLRGHVHSANIIKEQIDNLPKEHEGYLPTLQSLKKRETLLLVKQATEIVDHLSKSIQGGYCSTELMKEINELNKMKVQVLSTLKDQCTTEELLKYM